MELFLKSELHYNLGILGLYAIYCSYFTYLYCETCVKDCVYFWNILNSSVSLFDTGGSPINHTNFNYGEFVMKLIKLYEAFNLQLNEFRFVKKNLTKI